MGCVIEDAKYEDLLWSWLDPGSSDDARADAEAELLRRLGSAKMIQEVLRGRLELGMPLGTMLDWSDHWRDRDVAMEVGHRSGAGA